MLCCTASVFSPVLLLDAVELLPEEEEEGETPEVELYESSSSVSTMLVMFLICVRKQNYGLLGMWSVRNIGRNIDFYPILR